MHNCTHTGVSVRDLTTALAVKQSKVKFFPNFLNSTCYVMHQQFITFNNCTLCLHCIYVFCIYLRTNGDFCHLQHKLIGFYNHDEKCLQCGTDLDFKYSSLRFFCKGLIYFLYWVGLMTALVYKLKHVAIYCQRIKRTLNDIH